MFLKFSLVFTVLYVLGHLEDLRFFDHFETKLLNIKHFQIEVFAFDASFGYYRSEGLAFKHVQEK